MAAITLDIGGNTRRLDKDIQRTVNKSYNINLRSKGEQPLGRITGKVNEFTKSLDASNARVIAFGASAGIIYGIQKAFNALVTSTLEVQKSLQDINVILNISTQDLNKFGGELFNIAKNTGQSFNEVAKAATEFSRQGLGVTETLKRTNEALILSRLSGLDAAKSVEALTAAVNSFSSQAVTATEVVNKFANVDAAFAVSSADLAEAISRVGSSAAQSGVNLNELIAIVTSAQQTTARGGAVIGNSFKTIFTRLERGKVQDLLGSLGISTTDSSGQVKSTIQLLQDLGKVYDTLGAQQKSYVAEQVGGVFQINILKAALSDLGKEYSIYNSALNVASGATDQAIRRNQELNKTYSAQINALQENARQLAASGGERLLGPTIDRLVGGTNTLLSGFDETDGQGIGAVLGKGILDGIGQFIAGPGIALIGGVLLKLFRDLAKFATGSVQQLLGLNTAATQQQTLQASIQQILAKNPQLLELALKGEQGLNQAANNLLATLQAQTVQLEQQAKVAAQIAKAFVSQAGVRVTGGVPVVPTGRPKKAAGFIPNFASDKQVEKAQAIALGATPSVRAHMSKGTIDGRKFIMNSQETEFPGVGKNGDSMVIPHYAAKGFIPNFTTDIGKWSDFAKSQGLALKLGNKKSTDYKQLVKIVNKKGGKRSDSEIEDDLRQLAASRKGIKTTAGALIGDGKFAYMYAAQGIQDKVRGKVKLTKDGEPVPYSFTSIGTKKPFTFEDDINNRLTPIVKDLANKVLPQHSQILETDTMDFNQFIDKSAFSQVYGRLFEAVVNRALSKSVQKESGNQRFEFFNSELAGPNGTRLQDIFNSSNLGSFAAGDLKFRSPAGSPESKESFIKKMAAVTGIPYDASKGGVKILAARGFIPNFASTNRGVPVSQIRAHFDKSGNPIAVTNTRDEPNGLKDAIGRERKGIGMYSRGFVPNFAIEDPDTQAASFGTSVAAISAQLSGLAFSFAFTKDQYRASIQEIIAANKKAGIVTGEYTKAQQKATQKLLVKEKINPDQAAQRRDAAIYGPTGSQRSGAFFRNNSLGLSIAAPILGETIKNVLGQEGKSFGISNRGLGESASALGQIGSFAATGFMVGGGPWGAAIGGAIGALLTIPTAIDAFTSELPDLTAATKKANQDLTKFTDISQRLLTASNALKQGIEENSDPAKLDKVRNDLAAVISELNPIERERINNAIKLNKLDEELAKITEEKIKAEKGASRVEALEAIDSAKILGIFPKGFDSSTKEGEAQAKIIREAFNSLFTEGKNTQERLANFEKAQPAVLLLQEQLKQARKNYAAGSTFVPGSLKQNLLTILDKYTPDSDPRGGGKAAENRAKIIEKLTNIADDKLAGYIDLVGELIKTLTLDPQAIRDSDQSTKDYEDSKVKEAAALKIAKQRNEELVKSLQLSISAMQKTADSARAMALAQAGLARKNILEDTITRPKTIATKMSGDQSSFVKGLTLKEDIANIKFSQIESIENVKSKLIDSINEILRPGFEKNLELINNAKKTTEGMTSTNVEEVNKMFETQSQNQLIARSQTEQLLNQILQGTNGESLGDEKIQSVLEGVTQNLMKAGFDATQREQIILQILDKVENSNTEISNLKQATVQELKTLAKDQTQKILLQKIDQAQKFGGGIEEFLKSQAPGESLYDQLIKSAEEFKKFQGNPLFQYKPGTDQFKYNNPEAQRAREKIAPDYARETIRYLDTLRTLTGYTPSLQSKAGQAATIGLESYYKELIKSLEKLEKNSKGSPELQQQIRASLNSIYELGNKSKGRPPERNAAELQFIERYGTLTEDIFNKITGSFQSPVLQELQRQLESIDVPKEDKDILSQKIQFLSEDIIKSSDPTVKAINVTNNILKQILKDSGVEYTPLYTPKNTTPTDTVESKAKGYLPALVKEDQAIKRGVGGAKAGDRPQFIPNLNGMPAFVNTGEMLVDNYGGSRQTAVLTRDMQKAMFAANGFIPNFAPITKPPQLDLDVISQIADIKEYYYSQIKPIKDNLEKLDTLYKENAYREENEFVDWVVKKSGGTWTPERARKAYLTTIDLDSNFGMRSLQDEKLKAFFGWEPDLKKREESDIIIKDLDLQREKLIEKLKTLRGERDTKIGPDSPLRESVNRILQRGEELGGYGVSIFHPTDSKSTTLDMAKAFNDSTKLGFERVKREEQIKAEQKAEQDKIDQEWLNFDQYDIFRHKYDFIESLSEASRWAGLGPLEPPKNANENEITNYYQERARSVGNIADQYIDDKYNNSEYANGDDYRGFLNSILKNSSETEYAAKVFRWSFMNNEHHGEPEMSNPFYKYFKAKETETKKKESVAGIRSRLDKIWEKTLGPNFETDPNYIAAKATTERSLVSSEKVPLDIDPAQGVDKRNEILDRAFSESVNPYVSPEEISKKTAKAPGGISEQTARAIVQELDANYNQAISKTKSSNQATYWAQTQQRYRLLYSQGKYKELDAFYQSLKKDYTGKNFRILGEGTGRPGESVQPNNYVPSTAPYPGGISEQTARAIVQELDANYNPAIRNSRNPNQAAAWSQTKNRYHLLYNQGKYKELDAFYQSLKKDYQRPIGQNPNKFQNQTNFAQGFIPNFAETLPIDDYLEQLSKMGGVSGGSLSLTKTNYSTNFVDIIKSLFEKLGTTSSMSSGFIPNFAQNYISNLAKLESGLSGEDPVMGYNKNIGPFMYNKPQSRSGNLNEIIAKDHPEGLNAAIRNSMKMQKDMGVMSKGFIPNFATTDQSFTQMDSITKSNISALESLSNNIQNLNNSLNNINLEQLQPQKIEASAPQQTQNSNIGPFNVVLNPTQGNVASQINEALEKLKIEILKLVNVKVPPTTTPQKVKSNTA